MFWMSRYTVAANTKLRDILNGTQIQRIGPAGGQVSIAAVATGDVDIEVFMGDRQVIESADPNTVPPVNLTAANVAVNGPDSPTIPFDLILEDEPAIAGEFIVINVTGNTAGSAVLYLRINVEPLGSA